MLIIPIGTDTRLGRPPIANYVLIGLNVAVFLVLDVLLRSDALKAAFMLNAAYPHLHQYVTYQFLHADPLHLIGNMIFLWIFGNAVCDRMGPGPYVLFYLAGGVFSAVIFTFYHDNPLLGASGAIAAVTTAFLVLYPRVQVTLFVWLFVFITTIQLPSMLLIVFKIILYDNILAPALEGRGQVVSSVAYSAHLAGYAFGFATAAGMLAIRALPRNQFDILALWDRWRRRQGMTIGASDFNPTAARPARIREVGSRPLREPELTPVERLREDVIDRLSEHDVAEALQLYARLQELDPGNTLPRNQQLDIANCLANARRHHEAAQAYENFLSAYPTAPDVPRVRLMAGLIYNRYLHQYDDAIRHLREALDSLTLSDHEQFARDELAAAEQARTAS